MRLTKVSAPIATVALVFSLASPPRARAISNNAELALWIGGGVVAFIAAILVGTLLTRDDSTMFVVEPLPQERGEKRAVTVGLGCRGPDGRPAVICW